MSREAWEAGRAARAAKEPKDPPRDSYHAHYNTAWAAGWDAQDAAERVTHREPAVEHREPASEKRGQWPEGKELPNAYRRRTALPCPRCRCQFLPSSSPAVVVRATRPTVVYLRCRACDHRFSLPVQDSFGSKTE